MTVANQRCACGEEMPDPAGLDIGNGYAAFVRWHWCKCGLHYYNDLDGHWVDTAHITPPKERQH